MMTVETTLSRSMIILDIAMKFYASLGKGLLVRFASVSGPKYGFYFWLIGCQSMGF